MLSEAKMDRLFSLVPLPETIYNARAKFTKRAFIASHIEVEQTPQKRHTNLLLYSDSDSFPPNADSDISFNNCQAKR
jgi:hypothetical protein